jgi:hypothetical protein
MKKCKMNCNTNLLCQRSYTVILVLLSMMVLVVFSKCASVAGPPIKAGTKQQLAEPPEPPKPQKDLSQNREAEEDKDHYIYNFNLSLEKQDQEGEYSRAEIESFLCSNVENYIRAEEVYREGVPRRYIIKKKLASQHEDEAAFQQEVNKWFETQVTYTTGGKFTFLDIDAIKQFYTRVNQIIGVKKFVYRSDLVVANIVIQLAAEDHSDTIHEYIGETSVLQDNLRTRIGMKNRDIHIDAYVTGGIMINESRQIKFTPQELAFRQKERIVKVHLRNILDPGVRHFALVHELFHSIGFSGHSSYHESNLFPLPVKANMSTLLGIKTDDKIMPPMAERMIEMLYRPEMLPGMSVKEASILLHRMKYLKDTPKKQIETYLMTRKAKLIKLKDQLLERSKEIYAQRMSLYLELDRLELKELDLLAELSEILKVAKFPSTIIPQLKKSKSLLAKLGLLRRELSLIEGKNKALSLKSGQQKGKERSLSRRRIGFYKEEIAVLKDLLVVHEAAGKVDQKLATTRKYQDRKALEFKLRRVVRQLRSIDSELNLN